LFFQKSLFEHPSPLKLIPKYLTEMPSFDSYQLRFFIAFSHIKSHMIIELTGLLTIDCDRNLRFMRCGASNTDAFIRWHYQGTASEGMRRYRGDYQSFEVGP
jgi:hypothetical protein